MNDNRYVFQNQPPRFTQADVRTLARNRMVRSALLLSVISVFLISTGYLSLIPAGVAFITAVVSLGADEKPAQGARIAMILSLVTIALSYATIAYTFVRYIIPAIRSPELAGELDAVAMETYGVSFRELLDALAKQFGISR